MGIYIVKCIIKQRKRGVDEKQENRRIENSRENKMIWRQVGNVRRGKM